MKSFQYPHSRLSKMAVVLAVMISTSALAEEILPEAVERLPGNIQGVYRAGPDRSYIVYEKDQNCPDNSEGCSSYAVLENSTLRLSNEWIKGSVAKAKWFYNHNHLPTGSQGELYLPVLATVDDKQLISSIYKLAPTADNMPEEVFTFSSDGEGDGYTLKSFVFNPDFTQFYVSMRTRGENKTLLVAKDSGTPPDSYRWTQAVELNINSSLYVTDAAGEAHILSQGGSHADNFRSVRAVNHPEEEINRGAAWFSGRRAVSLAEDNQQVAYGQNIDQCRIAKIDLQQAVAGQTDTALLWTAETPGCGLIDNAWFFITSHQQRAYAGYSNAMYVFDRTSGILLFTVVPPAGTKFIDDMVFDGVGWGYRSFSGPEGSGVLAFSPDGKNQRQYLQAGVKGAPAIIGGHLYSASGNQLYRYKIGAPDVTQWKKVQQLHQRWLTEDHYRHGVVVQWTENQDGKSVTHQVKLDPRDTAEGALSQYRWPQQLATAINTLSASLRVGETPVNAPLASSYRNWVFQPAGQQTPVEFTFLPLDLSVQQRWQLNPQGSALCSYGDLPAGSRVTVTMTKAGSDMQQSKVFEVNALNGQRYLWPKDLADFINQNFFWVSAGEKIDDASSSFRQLYSGFRNRLWRSGDRELSIDLPVSAQVAEIADNCRYVP